jgi:hypothetical protein
MECVFPYVLSIAAIGGIDNSQWIAVLVDPLDGVCKDESIGLTAGLENAFQLQREPLVILIAESNKISV